MYGRVLLRRHSGQKYRRRPGGPLPGNGRLVYREQNAADENEGSGHAEGGGVRDLLHGDAEADTGGMQSGGGKDEAGGVEVAGSGGGHFRAVGETVEEGENADDGSARPEREADGEGDEKTKKENGGEDAGFHHGKLEARHAEDAAESHHANEAGGNGPDGAAAELGGPEADGDHGEEVIQTEDGVGDAVGEAVEMSGTGVRVRQRGQSESEQREQGFPSHGRTVYLEMGAPKGKIQA